MSKLNINRNTFLEREELLRFQKFVLNSPVNKAFLANTLSWGIVGTSSGTGTPEDFKIESGTSSGTIKMLKDSVAITESGLLIEKLAFDNLSAPSDGNWHWVKIGHKYSNIEEGTLSINANGYLTGTNTKFTEVLRGQSTEVPVKIKFVDSSNNTSTYEVVNVDDDVNALLAGDSFTAESNLRYIVIGSIPLGDTVTSQQDQGLYFYDDCEITFVQETIADTEPGGKVENEEFWLARVRNISGTVTVEDKREEYWTFYNKSLDEKLDKEANLSDVADVEEARQNLGIMTMADVGESFFSDTGWRVMDRGVAAATSEYDIKIRRKGSVTTITGKFGNNGANSSPGAILASIPYATIGESAKTTTNIYFTAPVVDHLNRNRGVYAYVKSWVQGDANLEIKILKSDETKDLYCFTITYINS